ncbi:hypothetical protein PTH_2766 [Pelotomaculum thermopropionicum SI]|uniref:Uncharacterized protein n=1 Tax=Pelotomaculum thermopropionicum (strain DSM 13744 / JCM 10971 / SI) TaxID=370438 RepID=A5CYK5_PELTS|nr:hypothetical protein PTH_2766 [Pelotomaculum thermopropionicum SI]
MGADKTGSPGYQDFQPASPLLVELPADGLQVFPEAAGQVRPFQGKFDHGLQVAELVAHVVTLPLEGQAVHGLLPAQHLQGVGKLDLPSRPGPGLGKNGANARLNDVTPHYRQAGRGFLARRLFHQVVDAVHAGTLLDCVQNPVFAYILFGHFHYGNNGGLNLLVQVHQLLQAGLFAAHDVIAQKYGKRLVPDELPGAVNGVAQAQRFLLPHKINVGKLADILDQLEFRGLAGFLELHLQFHGPVEVVFNGPFVPAGYNQDVAYARGNGFLHYVLDCGLIHDWQHFLGLCLGGGQKPHPQAGRRYNSFPDPFQ